MGESYSILIPEVASAIFSANPVATNTKVLLSVTITEKTVILQPDKIYSGEFYSGEV